ncbi:hypothetical protein [Streptomyces sp. NPDC058371]
MRWLGHVALAVVMAAVIGWAGTTTESAGAHGAHGHSQVLATDVGPTAD